MLLTLTLSAGAALFADAPPEKPYLVLTGTVLNEAPKAGETIKLRIFSKARPPWYFHGTRLFVYRKDAVRGCFENAKLKTVPHQSDRGYDSVELAPWEWFPRREEATVERTFSTANWLPGHYRIVIHTLYYPKEGSKGYVFSGGAFEFDLLPAAADAPAEPVKSSSQNR